MSVLRMSDTVRRAFGAANADGLAAGVGLPAAAQCWGCTEHIDLTTARPGAVVLSVLLAAPTVSIALFTHRGCGESRVFTGTEFEQVWEQALAVHADKVARPAVPGTSAAQVVGSPPPPDDQALIIDGRRVL